MKKININKHIKLFIIIIIIFLFSLAISYEKGYLELLINIPLSISFGIVVNALINKEILANDKMMYSKAVSVSIKATLYCFASLLLLNYILNSLDVSSIIYLK